MKFLSVVDSVYIKNLAIRIESRSQVTRVCDASDHCCHISTKLPQSNLRAQMADQLPEELMEKILSFALEVSEDMFTSRSTDSPFLRYDNPSSSAILEVCKQWLQIATPLLYNFVVIRSNGQSKALARTFRTNPAFGLFVEKMRLEGGYGAAMGAILLATPNVTDLFLSLDIRSNDSVPGLCRSLSSLDPVRVILQDFNHNPNGPTDKVIYHLCHSIPQWKRLVCDSPFP